VSSDDPTRHACSLSSAENEIESLGRRRWDRHDDLVGSRRPDGTFGLVETPDDADTEDSPTPHARVVVEEPHDALVSSFTKLAGKAPPGPSGADDEDA
jgi:hypothetical protein